MYSKMLQIASSPPAAIESSFKRYLKNKMRGKKENKEKKQKATNNSG